MIRQTLVTMTCALTMGVTLSGCGGSDDGGDAAAKEKSQENAVIEAYNAFIAEKQTIENSGDLPQDAYANTLTAERAEEERLVAKGYAEFGLVRVGQLETKEPEVIELKGDNATLLVCENEDGWGYKPKDEDVEYPTTGWTPRPMKAVKDGDRWRIGEALDPASVPAKDCG